MPRSQRPGSSPASLPLCDGPKLHRFTHYKDPIQWLERLDSEGERPGSEGYVFRARIHNEEYAVKVFKFFDPHEQDYFWAPLLGRNTSLQTAAYYTDPFYAECRAYGRIQEAIRKKRLQPNVAVQCHGFLFLKENDAQHLRANYNIDLALDEVDPDFQQKAIGGYQVRAIVKSLASQNTGVHQDSLGSILKGLKALNRHKIYVMDVRLDNYRDGMIVDFGSSWTEPYPPLDAMDSWNATSSRTTDPVLFDEMLEMEKIPNPKDVRATRNIDYCKRLRPRK